MFLGREAKNRQGFAAVRKRRTSEKLESEPDSIHAWDRDEASVPIERQAVTVEAGPSKCDSQDLFRVVIMNHRKKRLSDAVSSKKETEAKNHGCTKKGRPRRMKGSSQSEGLAQSGERVQKAEGTQQHCLKALCMRTEWPETDRERGLRPQRDL